MKPVPDHGEQTYRGSGRLEGCVAIVTGGDSGIGRAVALAFAREGASVVVSYLSETEDAEASLADVRGAGAEAVAVAGDLRDEAQCQDLIDQAVRRFGKLSILVNNAAYQETSDSVEGFSSESFDRIFKTNVYAPFYLSKAALRHLQPGDSIINTVSIQGYDPGGYLLPYASSKSALIGMTKAMAKLTMEQGVRVNAVAPGPVWTPFIPASMPGEKVKNFGKDTLFGRPAQPAELAPLYVWLASEDASYVTGEVFGATGGSTPL
ncbi:SDR family oxidoreductase [Pirellulimonas nuda]|nr:SDR family oxidoreductase [Pirellulimonas nuda]